MLASHTISINDPMPIQSCTLRCTRCFMESYGVDRGDSAAQVRKRLLAVGTCRSHDRVPLWMGSTAATCMYRPSYGAALDSHSSCVEIACPKLGRIAAARCGATAVWSPDASERLTSCESVYMRVPYVGLPCTSVFPCYTVFVRAWRQSWT